LNSTGVAALALGTVVAAAQLQEAFPQEAFPQEGDPSQEVFALGEVCTLEAFVPGEVCHICDRHKRSCVPNPDRDHSSHGKWS